MAARAAGAPAAWRERVRIELLEADRLDAARLGDRDDFAPERIEDDEAPRIGEILRHRVIVQRGREQHRPIGELAPQIAPDVVGQHRIGLELPEQRMHLARARADRSVDLADHDGAAVAEQDLARSVPVGAEIHEAAHRALGSDLLGDRDLVQAVLRREHEAVRREMRRELGQGGFGRGRFHRKHDAPVDAADVMRFDGRDHDLELVDRPGDFQPVGAARPHVLADDIDQQHRHARARPIGADRAADRARAPDQDRLAHRDNGVLPPP